MARAAGQEPGSPGDPARPGPGPGDCGTQHPPQGQRAGCSRGVCKDRLPSSGRSRGDVSGFADTRPLAPAAAGRTRHPAPCAATRAEGANPICACARLGCVSSRSASGPRAPRLLPLQSAPFRERVTMTHDPRAPGCAPRHPPAGLGRSGLWGGLWEAGYTASPVGVGRAVDVGQAPTEASVRGWQGHSPGRPAAEDEAPSPAGRTGPARAVPAPGRRAGGA